MRKKQFAALIRVEQDRAVERERDFEFWHLVQRGVLLTLQADGLLTPMQYQYAQKKLEEQCQRLAEKQGEI